MTTGELSNAEPLPDEQVPAAAEPCGHVRLQGVTIRAGSRVLLQDADATFAPREITLIVGSSGAGKTVLLRTLAGLVPSTDPDIRVTGELAIGSSPIPKAAGRFRTERTRVGVVFQNFALFDELSPLENVQLAAAHRPRRAGAAAERKAAIALLDELQVPRDVPTSMLSGGQRQRLAIARTLAYDPDVVLYDEPTSGLDPATAARVARLIRSTHAAHPTTSIIVTHDYEALAPIADRIFLFDAGSRALCEVERTEWPGLVGRLRPSSDGAEENAVTPVPRVRDWLRRLGDGTEQWLEGTTLVFEQALTLPLQLLPIWRSPRWAGRYLLHYVRLVAGPSAWIYLIIAGMISGFVTTYFTFRFLPFAQYTEPLIVENLLQSMGFALYRILVPVLATILIAARCGAAVASDIGGKVYSQQVDALRTFGIRPEAYLKTSVLYAFVVGTPLLTWLSFLSARFTSLIVFTATHPGYGPDYWALHFHRELSAGGTWYAGGGWLLAKLLICAAGIGLIAYGCGSRPKRSSRDVSHGITSSILWSTLFVLVVHFLFAFLEF